MTTEQEALELRNNPIKFGVVATGILIFLSVYSYIKNGSGIGGSLVILLISLFFVKLAYDAYNTPILYIRQYISAKDKFNEQILELRKIHKISKRNWLWRHIE